MAFKSSIYLYEGIFRSLFLREYTFCAYHKKRGSLSAMPYLPAIRCIIEDQNEFQIIEPVDYYSINARESQKLQIIDEFDWLIWRCEDLISQTRNRKKIHNCMTLRSKFINAKQEFMIWISRTENWGNEQAYHTTLSKDCTLHSNQSYSNKYNGYSVEQVKVDYQRLIRLQQALIDLSSKMVIIH